MHKLQKIRKQIHIIEITHKNTIYMIAPVSVHQQVSFFNLLFTFSKLQSILFTQTYYPTSGIEKLFTAQLWN